MKNKRIFSLLLAVVIFAGLICGCSIKNTASVATVDGVEISKSLFSYYLATFKASIEQQQDTSSVEDFWGSTEIEGKKAIDYVKEKALDECSKFVLAVKKADEEGITLTSEDNRLVGQNINQMMTQIGGRAKYEEYLKENFSMTDAEYKEFLENIRRVQLLTDKTVTENDISEYFKNDIARVKHVLILTQDQQTGEAFDDAKKAEAKKKAEDILSSAKGGANFDSLVAEYSEDPGSKSQPDGYYLGKGFVLGSGGAMVEEFESASLKLEVGAVSDIVETDYGYHIIKRYENSDEMLTEENKETIKAACFDKINTEWKEKAVIVKNEKVYNSIN